MERTLKLALIIIVFSSIGFILIRGIQTMDKRASNDVIKELVNSDTTTPNGLLPPLRDV